MPSIEDNLCYSVSGCAAHTRFVPLLPPEWKDCSPNFKLKTTSKTEAKKEEEENEISFVWENAPRRETKAYRDNVKAYSHLPNGTAILDSKWVLARLFEKKHNDAIGEMESNFPLLAYLESHCFRGPDGYLKFCVQVLFNEEIDENKDLDQNSDTAVSFPDLLFNGGKCPTNLPKEPSSLWVVKDAFSNGAGGIWVVDKESAATLQTTNNNGNDGPLYDNHRYVAQRYAWPPVLYGGRKCHVRVYGLITADGRAFVHKRAFLHVANDDFSYETNRDGNGERNSPHFEDSVHITNCCANSHDDAKFAGEILADLEAMEPSVEEETGQTIVPLAPFFASMKSSLAALTQRAWPFISGGQRNGGLEYLGKLIEGCSRASF